MIGRLQNSAWRPHVHAGSGSDLDSFLRALPREEPRLRQFASMQNHRLGAEFAAYKVERGLHGLGPECFDVSIFHVMSPESAVLAKCSRLPCLRLMFTSLDDTLFKKFSESSDRSRLLMPLQQETGLR
jgi:hypothetical protein